MPVPHVSENFGDLLDPRFQEIFHEQYEELPDMLPMLFTFPADNGRADMRWSQMGSYGDWSEFTSSTDYQSATQGFDTLATHREFASGIQVRRKLFDDDQYNIMDQMPRGLATAAQRTRQKHGARIFNQSTSVDTFFYVNSEAVALCSDSHTTNNPNTSTATGFDNLTTTALSATALTAARKQMVDFLDDAGNEITITPDELWIPHNLFDVAWEIVASMGKVDTAENNRNVHQGAYTIHEWKYLSDTNDWWLSDSALRRMSVFWVDRVSKEFAMAEDLDTKIAKWAGYMRYSNAQVDWRWVLGASVS